MNMPPWAGARDQRLRRWWRRRVRPLPQEPWEQALDDAAEATGQDIDQ